MQRILVSACLLGEKVRYDGSDCLHPGMLQQWVAQGRVITLCPEVAGGLSVPRPPAEIVAGAHSRQMERVCRRDGLDVSAAFMAGAERAWALCRKYGIRVAVLKEGSPSCGSSRIHDGSFRGRKIAGQGITARLLQQHGVHVFSEMQLEEVEACLQSMEAGSGRE